jgi:hypothetical protein
MKPSSHRLTVELPARLAAGLLRFTSDAADHDMVVVSLKRNKLRFVVHAHDGWSAEISQFVHDDDRQLWCVQARTLRAAVRAVGLRGLIVLSEALKPDLLQVDASTNSVGVGMLSTPWKTISKQRTQEPVTHVRVAAARLVHAAALAKAIGAEATIAPDFAGAVLMMKGPASREGGQLSLRIEMPRAA